jgi:SAM-dependent methyltransferase
MCVPFRFIIRLPATIPSPTAARNDHPLAFSAVLDYSLLMNTDTAQWNMGRLMELATGYWKSAVLSAGVELGLFEQLSDGPLSATELAAAEGVPERYVAEILDALTALELLEKKEDTYRIAAGADALMNKNSASCILDALRFNMDLYPIWGKLATCVRQGAPAIPPSAHLGGDNERTRRFAMGMHSRALGMAPVILPAIKIKHGMKLLDVACGPGTFSRLLAEQHDDIQVTQFDLPPVLEVARELTASSAAAGRIHFAPGDYHKDPLPKGFDLILLSGAIHQEDEVFARELFARINASLNPGGRFLLIDMMLEPDRTGPLFSNLFSINMMLTSPAGRVFTADQLQQLVQDAGFAEVNLIKPPWSPYWILETRDRY